MSRDTSLGLNFAGVNYYDGQGFMVRKKLGIDSALKLAGASVCTQQGTTTELNLADYFRANKMKYEVVAFATSDETIKAYESGRCDAFTTDASGLYAERLKLTAPDEHVVLPEIISKEPLGPSVRNNDPQWFALVKWVGYAMVNAEELGVTKANVGQQAKSDNPEIKRLLGTEADTASSVEEASTESHSAPGSSTAAASAEVHGATGLHPGASLPSATFSLVHADASLLVVDKGAGK